MRMIWTREASPQVRVGRTHLMVWDFFRMLFAAIMCGVAVSVIAAGIALVLAHDASAAVLPQRTATSNNSDVRPDTDAAAERQPYPGMLLLGNGCDADIVEALERDWKVSIDGNNIDVRVMQTFIIPDGDTTMATFNALLPNGARLLRLSAHTVGGLWQGKVFDAHAYGHLTATDFRRISRQGMLIVQNDDGAISTDAIINIAATEVVILEYTYRVVVSDASGISNLLVTLSNSNELFGQNAGRQAVSGAVWVEWLGKKPAQLFDLPGGVLLETSGSRITGLSWATQQIKSGARLQFAWLL